MNCSALAARCRGSRVFCQSDDGLRRYLASSMWIRRSGYATDRLRLRCWTPRVSPAGWDLLRSGAPRRRCDADPSPGIIIRHLQADRLTLHVAMMGRARLRRTTATTTTPGFSLP